MGLLSEIIDMFIQKKLNSEISITPSSNVMTSRFLVNDLLSDSKLTKFIKDTVGIDENYEFSDKSDLEIDGLVNQKIYMVPDDKIDFIYLEQDKKKSDCVKIISNNSDSNFVIGKIYGDSAVTILKLMEKDENEDYLYLDMHLDISGGPYKILKDGKINRDSDPYSVYLVLEYKPDNSSTTKSAFDI